MPQVVQVTKTLYQYDELSDSAKEKAREWWKRAENEDFDTEFVIEDAVRMGEILGIQIGTRSLHSSKGKTYKELSVFWSGFWSQGDGASFDGSYDYRVGSVKKIKVEAPQDETLHRIAQELHDVQKKHFYQLRAECKHSGPYQHSGWMRVEVSRKDRDGDNLSSAEKDLTKILRSFADWIYSQLEKEYDYRTSDENVEECIRINEYTFLESGKRED